MTAVAYYILFVLLAAAVKLLLWKLQLLWGTNHFITRTDFARLLAVLLLLHQGMDVTVQWGMRQEHVVASFCAHWPSQCWHPPCRPAARRSDPSHMMFRAGPHSRLGFFYYYYYLFFYIFLRAPSKLRLASHINCLSACVSLCLSLSGRTGSAVGSVRVFSNTPITNYYATATLTDAHSHRGQRSVLPLSGSHHRPLVCPHRVVEAAFLKKNITYNEFGVDRFCPFWSLTVW